MIKAVIFDLDGVLIDTEHLHVDCMVQCYKECEIDLTDEEKLHMVARSPKDYIPLFAKKYTTAHEFDVIMVRFVELYFERWKKDVTLMPHAIETLEALHKKGLVLALATSSPRDIVDLFFEKFDTGKYFSHVAAGNEVKHRKPHPEIYELALKRLGLPKESVIVIEDSQPGIEAAHGAGLTVYAVPSDHTSHHDFVHAKKTLMSLQDVLFLVH